MATKKKAVEEKKTEDEPTPNNAEVKVFSGAVGAGDVSALIKMLGIDAKNNDGTEIKPENLIGQSMEEKNEIVRGIYENLFMTTLSSNKNEENVYKAIKELRVYEMELDDDANQQFQVALKAARENIVPLLMRIMVDFKLRLIDIPFIFETLAKDCQHMAVWEYRNVEKSDMLLGIHEEMIPLENTEGCTNILNAMGKENE